MSTEKTVGAASGAMSGAAIGAKYGTALGPWGMAAGAVVGGLIGLFGTKKTKKPPARKPLDIAALISQAREQAEVNLSQQLRLEQQYLPNQAAFRSVSDQNLAQLGREFGGSYVADLLKGMGNAVNFLPEGSSARMILEEAKLGANLSPDVQAEVAKAALEGAGRSGISGSAAGRGLVARDIGQSAAALRASRLSAGANIENILAQRFFSSEQARVGGILESGRLSAARMLPEAGLSAGSIADLTISENNAGNQYAMNMAAAENARRQAQNAQIQGLFTQAAGTFGGSLGGAKTATPTPSTSTSTYNLPYV